MKRPSGHDISDKFSTDNGAAIPPNLLAIANTESNSFHLRYCKERGIKPHPARFPAALPEFFIRMLTDPGDLVYDPFGGSCVTGEVCERLEREWICSELSEDYPFAAKGRFVVSPLVCPAPSFPTTKVVRQPTQYKISSPGAMWNGIHDNPLAKDGGRNGKRKKPMAKVGS